MNLTTALSIFAIIVGLANITFVAVILIRDATWRNGWKWRYRNWRNDRYIRALNHSR